MTQVAAQRRKAYAAGWAASARADRTGTVDLDRAEGRWCRTHPDPDAMFSAGWVDYSVGHPKWTALRNEHPEDFRR